MPPSSQFPLPKAIAVLISMIIDYFYLILNFTKEIIEYKLFMYMHNLFCSRLIHVVACISSLFLKLCLFHCNNVPQISYLFSY